MSAKRSATTELNRDNWNEEHEPEEAGTFTKAPDDILEKRVVKRAKRRLQATEDNTKSTFGTFSGFKATSTSHNSPFSFLANSNTSDASLEMHAPIDKSPASNGASKGNENGTNKKENSETQTSSSTITSKKSSYDQEDQNIFKKSSDYFAKLKGLNESVAQWIKTHVDANPFCILTPIFKDYERYLKEIESKHGNGTEKTMHTSEPGQPVHTSDSKESANTEKKLVNSPFGGTNTKSPPLSTDSKSEKSIFDLYSYKSIFGKSEHTVDNSKSIFSHSEQPTDPHKSVFGNREQKASTKNIFGNVSSEKNPFLSKLSTVSDNKSEDQESKSDTKSTGSSFGTAATFCFGQSSTTGNTPTGFSFGSAKPFTFGAQVVKPQESEDKSENEGKDEKDEEPPKADFKPVTEEGAIYEQRCIIFMKKDGSFTSRGVGVLFLKPTPNDKMQLIVRAETSLGNLLLNTLLTKNIPTRRINKNTIMVVCLPKPESLPPPVSVLLRVKTDEDADALIDALNKHKK
ncbi:nuclear pore complex protein Nup50 isoform X1 [Colletes gigas]|uniref:nuclear pore complex protein Nup50 isoform X1 n=2 Tax=Colletes gigas TaxID=935657 RepID=UPI001C9B8F70|nr:nuclear pore complex protein Nup50 isoform X1 [Colletes gigas]XP_043253078.1 nuclear pore complex protein Nup50 isoform X1 [Colletes gigas]XP_043253080.1 nuclear pore complex protein Nup50 isoform X1 [Colletes gigas]XP_043253081.1 nuclear pore complex protein Nup50 isoform X1 [Colletes gigas]XP_043253082.1 nuclear pore complex protein Nup50 isoform X1 [Colletes gigas]